MNSETRAWLVRLFVLIAAAGPAATQTRLDADTVGSTESFSVGRVVRLGVRRRF